MSDKVVDLSKKREEKAAEPKDEVVEKQVTFDEIIKKNAEKKTLLEAERKKANKGVIRSYRLK